MNVKKIGLVVLSALMLCTAGCGQKEEVVEGKTIGTRLASVFHTEVSANKSVEEIAQTLSGSDEFGEITMIAQPVEEGYLAGFSTEITGFEEGACFMPMISTIPFVGYVFKTEDPEALASVLKENADQNWNICTQADETVVETDGSYVYFCMAPESFE